MCVYVCHLYTECRDTFWSSQQQQQQQQGPSRRRPLVACSIGPYGAFLANAAEYTGEYDMSREQLKEFHRQRLRILLAKEKPDLLACETLPILEEAEVLVELLEEEEHAHM